MSTPSQRAVIAYAGNTAIRALVQCIPYIGGPLDTILSSTGAKLRDQRVMSFLVELDERLKAVPPPSTPLSEENLFDLMSGAFDKVVRAHSEQKRSRFAQIVARQVQQGGEIDEASRALRMLAELEDEHIEVLLTAMTAPLVLGLYEGARVVTIAEKPNATPGGTTSLRLQSALPHHAQTTLRLVCAELVAKGLFQDVGVGTIDGKAMQYFSPTDLAGWFLRWIRSSGAS